MSGKFSSKQITDHILCSWPLVLIVPLIPVPLPSIVAGHPWRAELFLSVYLIAAAACFFFARSITHRFSISQLLPVGFVTLFTAWGSSSALWAGSFNSVLHHTFLWSIYLIFFVLQILIVSRPRLLKLTLKMIGLAAAVYCLSCVSEYFLRDSLDSSFGFRYGRFAEISATICPLFLALFLRSDKKASGYAFIVVLCLWFQIVCALSRASMASAIIGLLALGVGMIFLSRPLPIKRGAIAVSLLILVSFVPMILGIVLPNPNKGTVLDRLATTQAADAENSLSGNIRYFFALVSLEMIKDKPISGVGADNFNLEFNKYRKGFLANEQNLSFATYGEDYIPERAHNEYLQTAAELGIVGLLLFLLMVAGLVGFPFRDLVANRKNRNALIIWACLCGMGVFLISSMFSSFSFRLGQNGVVFLFLAALAMSMSRRTGSGKKIEFSVMFSAAFIIVSLLSTGYFASKGVSQYLTNKAEFTSENPEAMDLFDKALTLDPANGSAYALKGLRLLKGGEYVTGADDLRTAVDNGINPISAYSYLISGHVLTGNINEAIKTAEEAVAIFPRSVFMRTRLALLLEKNGQTEMAAKEFAVAAEIDARSAETWKILIAEGKDKAAEAGRNGVGIPLLADLKPLNGVYAILFERELMYPEERFKFPPTDTKNEK